MTFSIPILKSSIGPKTSMVGLTTKHFPYQRTKGNMQRRKASKDADKSTIEERLTSKATV